MHGICKNEKRDLSAASAIPTGPLRNYSELGKLMGVKSPVLRKATDMEERKCRFIEHLNPKPALIKCNCMAFTERSERHQ